MSVRAALAVWLISMLIGGAIVALPDSGQRLVSFSDAHGPSLLDAAGIVVAVGGWLIFVTVIFRRRTLLHSRLSAGPKRVIAPFIVGLGAGLVIASVLNDFAGWWLIGAALLFGVQIWLARHVM